MADGPVRGGSELGNFQYQLLAFIGRNWRINRQWATQDLRVIISLRVQRDGRLTDIRIIQTSGLLAYDQAAFAALQQNPQGPPLPDYIKEDSVEVNVALVSR